MDAIRRACDRCSHIAKELPMNIVFVLYDEMTALDLVGPYQVFAMVPNARVSLAATSPGPKKTDSGMVITAAASLRDLDIADVIVVPGTSRPQAPIADRALLDWLASVSAGARWTCSVCTGSLVLGAAGLLQGRRATTHWSAHAALRDFGAVPVQERVVFDGAIVTAAGVSAGIDMALAVVARSCSPTVAQAIQLGIEYDPQPPFDSGSPASAGPEIVEVANRMMQSVVQAWGET
jgi:transcriptional regulator GlxA family with amidase domain